VRGEKSDSRSKIWLEKDALAGVVYEVTAQWDVPLMVTRGFPSVSFLHSAAEIIKAKGKPAYLYYFGDHDPSGVHIDRNTERQLREMAPGADITFRRVAVLEGQIKEWGLPSRPTKKSDSRSKTFAGDSVELDSIPPGELRHMVAECIFAHLDRERLKKLLDVEEHERETFERLQRFLPQIRRDTPSKGD
jgi:hypothetical protein